MAGGAANVAGKAAELNAEVTLVGLVGSDAEAGGLRTVLSSWSNLKMECIADQQRPTTLKTRFISHNQQLLRVYKEHRGFPTGFVLEQLVDAAYAACATADAVILEDYGKGVLSPEVIAAAIKGARQSGAPLVVDPNGRDYRRYAGTTVLTPNLREAEVAAERPITDTASLEDVGAILVNQTGSALAITREAEGISLFRNKPAGTLDHTHIPTVPVEVYDVTGAGDAVAATMAIALASGIELAEACALANVAGRVVVRQHGVGTISQALLLEEVRRGSEATRVA
jgi:D-beta-D-heptose 7-phosphate kinase/D-beta-D-heptose 1-phosphate adenosyltransferase